jgi:multicomponent K+:H+ antiporter subunit F
MNMGLIGGAITIAQFMLVIAMALCLFRMVRGPRAQDRVLALDALYITGMLTLVTIGIRTGSPLYFEISVIIALLGFAGTVGLAKFLMRGEVIE